MAWLRLRAGGCPRKLLGSAGFGGSRELWGGGTSCLSRQPGASLSGILFCGSFELRDAPEVSPLRTCGICCPQTSWARLALQALFLNFLLPRAGGSLSPYRNKGGTSTFQGGAHSPPHQSLSAPGAQVGEPVPEPGSQQMPVCISSAASP